MFSASALLAAVATLQAATPPPAGAADVRPGLVALARAAGLSGPAMPALKVLGPGGLPAGAGFGTSVAGTGALLVVGAPTLAGGRAYVYSRQAGGWRQTAELRGSGTQAGDFFGGAVAIAAGTTVVGAGDHDDAVRGHVFTRGRRAWHQTAELASGRNGSGAGPICSARSVRVGARPRS